MNEAARRPGDFWAITSYFNPAVYKRRYANYRHFRQRLALPLVAVELSFNGSFELGPGDADILIQLTGGDVIWQKERLLNLALDALPAECNKVLSVDCDVIFPSDDWVAETTRLLKQFPLVHACTEVLHMGPDWSPEQSAAVPLHVRPSPARLARERPLADVLAGQKIAYGFAWAASRDLFSDLRFYDACIVGSGDFAVVCAAYQSIDTAMRYHHMGGSRRQEHFLAWAEPFARAIAGNVGYVDQALMHLWHGALRDRHYVDRVDGLASFGFDPFADIAMAENGVWRWSSDKPAMHAYVRNYFDIRREDG